MSGFSSISIRAKTHHAGYAFHKYWARKPHNVVAAVLREAGLSTGDIFVDPFCGSGVPASEAAVLGAETYCFDVNPTACLLTEITLTPPDPSELETAIVSLIEKLRKKHGIQHIHQGKNVRYWIHSLVVVCPGCKKPVSFANAKKIGRTYSCLGCGIKLRFNLKSLVATHITGAVAEDGSKFELDLIVKESKAGMSSCDQAFAENPRILAFAGMKTSDLFTRRNFRILEGFAEGIEKLPERLRPSARVVLTAASTQSSRLIAYRGGLVSGGPAWTVPGFWVPPIHMEMNPFFVLKTKLRKVAAGLRKLRELSGRGGCGKVHLSLGDTCVLIRKALKSTPKPKVIFLDPPYGDSIPYLEFSSVWNSFVGRLPSSANDISVSDRRQDTNSWTEYARGFGAIIKELSSHIDATTRVVLTFNNHNMRAWASVMGPIQAEGLRCLGAFYQEPAVVSTKSQLAKEGSYQGDFYVLFAKDEGKPLIGAALLLKRFSRDYEKARAQPVVMLREKLLAALRQNLKAEDFTELEGSSTERPNEEEA